MCSFRAKGVSIREPPRVSPYPTRASGDAHRQGEPPKVIQLCLGHSSIQVALDTHGRLFEGRDEGAADRLDVGAIEGTVEQISVYAYDRFLNRAEATVVAQSGE